MNKRKATGRPKNGNSLPWFRLYASEFRHQTTGMTMAVKGIYISLLAMMHERSGPIQGDVRWLARAIGTPPVALKSALEILISAGLLHVIDSGELWSPASQREFETNEKESDRQREKSHARWGKDKENQQNENAAGYREYESMRGRETDPHTEDQSSHSKSEDSKGTTSRSDKGAARDGAATHQIMIDDEIHLDGFGLGWVQKIISRNPLVTIVRTEDRIDGGTRAFRVEHSPDGRLRKRPMTEAEVGAFPDQPDEDRSANDAA